MIYKMLENTSAATIIDDKFKKAQHNKNMTTQNLNLFMLFPVF